MRFRGMSGLLFAGGIVLLSSSLKAEEMAGGQYGVQVEVDRVYGQGMVGASGGSPRLRDLRLDVYRPLAEGRPQRDRPAVIVAFGGAFHRGTKGTARFEEDGASDSSMGEYCRAFAAEGYVCLSTEYRLVQEDPALPIGLVADHMIPKAGLRDPVATARIDVVRGRMGLPLLDHSSREQLWNTVFAAAEDLAVAVRYARAHGKELGLDPDRIAVGGFSAGAANALNVAYGLGEPVQAAFLLSGTPAGFDIRKTARSGMPPVLMTVGQNDLPAVQSGTRFLSGALSAAGVPVETAWIPGFGHFYPMGATSLGNDLTRQTLLNRILGFLARHLQPAAVGFPPGTVGH